MLEDSSYVKVELIRKMFVMRRFPLQFKDTLELLCHTTSTQPTPPLSLHNLSWVMLPSACSTKRCLLPCYQAELFVRSREA